MTAKRTFLPFPTCSSRAAPALLAGLALLAACSGPVAGIEIDIAGDSVVLIRGGSATVDVVLTRSGGASGPVALTVNGLPASVAASFAPPTLVGTTAVSVLTLSAESAAAAGTTTATVVAEGASGTDTATLALEVASLTVDGHVTGIFGFPIAGVAIASQGEASVTDADGRFALDGLSVPYDLAVTAPFGTGAVHVYEGLTTATPVLSPAFAFNAPRPPFQTAAITGDVLGGGTVGADRVVIVCAEGLERVVFGCDFVSPGDGTFAVDATWIGPATTSVRVHALHYEHAADFTPTAYLGYEAFDRTVSDGAAEVHDLALAPVASVLVEGSIEAADGLAITGVRGGLRFGPRFTMLVFGSPSLAGDVAVLMPAPTGATFDLTASADGVPGRSFAWSVEQGSDFGTLSVPAPLVQVAPADAAVGVDLATAFESSGGDEVRTYVFTGPGPLLAITTNRDSVTPPNPDLGGFTFPAGEIYTWYAFGHGTADADDASSRSLLDFYLVTSLMTEGGPGHDRDGSFTFGTARTFTFAP